MNRQYEYTGLISAGSQANNCNVSVFLFKIVFVIVFLTHLMMVGISWSLFG